MNRILKSVFVVAFIVAMGITSYAEKNDVLIKENNSSILIENPSTLLKANALSSTDVDLKILNLQFDMLGFVFFGPQVSLDFQFANFFSVGPYIRWNYAGVLYQGFITDWWSPNQKVDPNSMGIGGSFKILPPVGSGRHRPYIDLGYERFHGSESYDSGNINGLHIWEYKSHVLHFGAGYRMTTDASFNLSVGMFFALSIEDENIDYYELAKSETMDTNFTDTKFFFGIQLNLGFQMGK